MSTTQEVRDIMDIVIGKRIRKSLNNIPSLAVSIARVGLLNPPVITTKNELLAGERRLAAMRHLGWTQTPVRVIADLDDDAALALRAEMEENTEREELTPAETVAAGKRLEELERPQAKERRKEGGRAGGQASGNLPEASTGNTRDKVAAALGVSGRAYEKAKAVVQAADKEPEKFADLREKLSQPMAKVDPVYRELKRRQNSGPVAPDPAPPIEVEPNLVTGSPVEKTPPERRRGVGIALAHEAMNCLKRIPDGDPHLAGGLTMVENLLAVMRGPDTARPTGSDEIAALYPEAKKLLGRVKAARVYSRRIPRVRGRQLGSANPPVHESRVLLPKERIMSLLQAVVKAAKAAR